MARKKSTRLMILLAIMGALVLLIAQLSGAFAGAPPRYVSTNSSGEVDGVDFTRDDILVFEYGWEMYFDGEDYELDPTKHDIEAFHVEDEAWTVSDSREIYMSFFQNKVMVNGLGQVMGQDVIQFTEVFSPSYGYTYTRYFDGSDVGLTTVNEKIDGLDIDLYGGNGEIECPVYIFISTLGEYSIPAANSGTGVKLQGDGSDVLLFCATNTGEATAGFWYLFFDGQDEGMAKNFVDSIADVSDHGDHGFLAFLTPAAFSLDDAFGGHSEAFIYHGNSDPDDPDPEFFGPAFSAPDEGLNAFVDGLDGFFDD